MTFVLNHARRAVPAARLGGAVEIRPAEKYLVITRVPVPQHRQSASHARVWRRRRTT